MSPETPASPEVFTIHEIAAAGDLPPEQVKLVLETGETSFERDGFVPLARAVAVILELRRLGSHPRWLFAPTMPTRSDITFHIAASGVLHVLAFGIVMVVAGVGMQGEPAQARAREPARLVFLSARGPGGGGGGGGQRSPKEASRAALRGPSQLRSPVAVTRTAEQREVERRIEKPSPAVVPEAAPDPEPPPPQPLPTPPVVAPVVSAPSDETDRVGTLADAPTNTTRLGPGSDGGAGSGRGAGIGEGSGAGIGDGTIAGTGGGPYRPGSGITPPTLLREVKPTYTEDGRRRGVEGEVVMEVVVRSDGSVGTMRIIRGLGAGLNERATEAVRLWRFAPARRYGTPVDVLVEVAVEFRLR